MKYLNIYLIYAALVSSLLLLVSPLRATTCANAIPITTFPVFNQALVCGTDNDLSATTVPEACSNINAYKGGKEALYSFIPDFSGTYFISCNGKPHNSILVFDGCPTSGGSCIGSVASSVKYKTLSVSLTAGITYYIWFDLGLSVNESACPGVFNFVSSQPNDDCSGAIAFPPFIGDLTSVTGSTLGATGTPDPACSGVEDDDVWYTFTTPAGVTALQFSTSVISGNGLGGLQLFEGTCGNLTSVRCDSDSDSDFFTGLSANTTYYLRVYTTGSGVDYNSNFNLHLSIIVPPVNDECAGALIFPPVPTNGDCSELLVNTTTASGSAVPNCLGQQDDDLWYAFTPPPGYTFVSYRMTSLSGGLDCVLEAFSGTCNELVSIGCYDAEAGAISGLTPNTMYYFRVHTKGTFFTSIFNLCLSIESPPNDFCEGAFVFPAFTAPDSCAILTVSTENATGTIEGSCGGFPNDDVWCSFTTPPGVTYLRFNFIEISGDTDRDFRIYRGPCNDLTLVGCYSGGATSGILGGLAGNTTYYLRVYTGGSSATSTFQVCLRLPLANDNCTGAFPFPPIPLDNTCASVTATTVTATSSSGNPNSQDPCGGYSDDDIWFTFITPPDVSALFYRNTNISGSTNRAIEVLEGTCAGLVSRGCYGEESGLMSGLSGNTTYYLRAYAFGSGSTFAATSTFNICLNVPLPNDYCTGATAFPVIPPGGDCATISAATTLATGSSSADCGGVPDDDVWFSFFVPSGATTLEYNIVPVSGSTDLVIRLYRGSCTTNVGCFDAENGSFTALIPNTTYYLKVFTKAAGAHSVFDFCLRRVPGLANDICAGAFSIPNLPADGSCVATTISTISATGLTDAACIGAEDDDVWYTFTTPPGHTSVYYGMTNVSGSSNRVLRVYQGTCPSALTSVGCFDNESGTMTGLSGNTTYYLRAYTYDAGVVSTFKLCLGVVPRPVNDDCSGAIAFPELPMDGACSALTITTEGASGLTSSTCTGAEDDDVWYTFTTPPGATSVVYDFVNISGSTNRAFQVFQGACSGLTSIGCYNPAMGGFISGLSGGGTYYLRIYTQPSGVASTFQLCLRVAPAPPNDDCSGAVAFPDIPSDGNGVTIQFTTFGATGIPDSTCQGTEDDDVWLTFTVPLNVTTLLYNYTHLAGNDESNFQLYSGDCDNLTPFVCHFNTKNGFITGLSSDSTYYMRVYTRLANVAGTFKLTLKAAAPNDECINATPFPDFPLNSGCAEVSVPLSNATPSNVSLDISCAFLSVKDLWYSFSVPPGVTSLRYQLNGTPSGGEGFQLFTGDCSGLTSLGCLEDGVLSGLSSGVVYFLRIYEYNTYPPGALSFCLRVPPSNDECSGAMAFPPIPADGSCSGMAVNTVGALGTNDPTCPGTEDDDVWYTFTTPPGVTTLWYSVSNLVSFTNVNLQVYSGDECSGLTHLACYNSKKALLTGLSGNTTYYMRISTSQDGNNNGAAFDICLRLPVLNDDCSNAIAFPALLTDGSCTSITGSTEFATGTIDPVCTGSEDDDVWFSFTTPAGVNLVQYETLATSGDPDLVLQVYSGECGNLTSIGCYDPASGVITGLSGNTTYYLRVYTWYDDDYSVFSLCLRLVNDDCDGAFTFPDIPLDGSCATITATTTYATGAPDPTCAGGEEDDVWFTFTTPPGISALGYENITISGSTNRVLQIFSGECGNLTSIGCYDPENGTITGLNGNTTYYLRAYTSSSFDRAVFNICLRVPASNDACSGAIAFPAIPTDGSCVTLNISTKFATGSADPTCAGTEDDDVWYTFTTPPGVTRLVYQGYGTLDDVNFQYFSGSCGSLTSLGCFNFTSSSGIITGLTGNTTYYLRAYTSSTGVSRTGDFCLRLLLTNDDCSGAISFPSIPLDGSCATVSASATGATGSPDPTCAGVEDDDVWYTFTTPPGVTTLWYEINSTPFNEYKVLEIFSGSCNNRISIGCYAPLTPAHGHITGLSGNTTYYMRAYSNASTTSVPAFDICLRVPPPNDHCANAIAFPDLPLDGSCVTMNVSTVYASPSAAPTTCMDSNDADVWYTFTTPPGTEAVWYQVSGISGAYPVVLEVLSGSCGNLTSIGCNNPYNGGGTFTGLVGGATYYLRAHTTTIPSFGNTFSICLQPTPVNDFCQYATAFPDIPADGSCATVVAHTGKAVGTEALICDDSQETDVWFTFTTPPNITYLRCEINSVSGNVYGGLQVLSGSCGNLVPLECYLGSPGFITGLTGNTTYYLRAFSTSTSDNAAFSICLKLPLPNDNCADAMLIGDCNTTITGSFFGAAADGLTSNCVVNVNPNTKGLWYRLVGDGLPVMLHTCLDSDGEAGIIVYSGSCGSEVCITGNAGACGSGSQVNWVTTAGEEYYVFVYPFSSTGYGYDFTLSIIGGVQCPSVIGQTTMSIDTLNAGVTISWPATAGIADYDYALSTAGSCSTGTIETTTDNSVSFSGLEPDTEYTFCLRSYCSCYETDFASLTFTIPPCEEPLGAPWATNGIGNAQGNAINNYCGRSIDISSDGVSSSGSSDGHFFASQNFCDTLTITAKVNDIMAGSFAGIAFRESTAPGSRMIALKIKKGKYVYREVRSTTNGGKTTQQFFTQTHTWLRMVRNGNTFTGYSSGDGVNWQQHFSINLAMPSCLDAGLFVESTQVDASALVSFSNVSMVPSTSTVVLPGGTIPTGDIPTGNDPDNGYTVYPNPAHSTLSVKMDQVFFGKELTIAIHNQFGQRMAVRQIEEVQDQIETFDIQYLPPGVYTIILRTEGREAFAKKFVVVR